MALDADKVFERREPTELEWRADVLGLLRVIADRETPGVPGVEGGQLRDEIDIRSMTVPVGETFPISGSRHRRVLTILNNGSGTLYVTRRSDQVPASDGFPLVSGASVDVSARGTLYVTAAGSTCDVRLWEERT